MALLSFMPRFVPGVENGLWELAPATARGPLPPHPFIDAKRQTIRAERKDDRPVARVGETLHLWTGARTKHAVKLGEAHCRFAREVTITHHRGFPRLRYMLKADGWPYSKSEERRIARLDGFDRVDDFFDFFARVHGLPFYGWIIRW